MGLAVLTGVAVAMLAGCAQLPDPPPPDAGRLWRDAAFAPPVQAPQPGRLFEASEAMRRFAAELRAQPRSHADPRRHLIDQLYSSPGLALRYDTAATRTAAEAFEARAGNCLSLVAMTVAFARELGLPVRLQQVDVAETWSRVGDLQFASAHVNIALEPPLLAAPAASRIARDADAALVVDFLPQAELRGQRARAVSEATVTAMYLNNRAAEHLAEGALADAYWHAREATRQDPRYAVAWNTLGVIYLRRGLAADAVDVFQAVLAREPENAKSLANLVGALHAAGRPREAEAAARRLAAIEPLPPFHFLDAGIAAMRSGDFARARELLQRELRRAPDFHETHLRLAQVEMALGDWKAARQHLERARRASATARDAQLYAAKLEHLRLLQR